MSRLSTVGFESQLLTSSTATTGEPNCITSGTVTIDKNFPRSGAACAKMTSTTVKYVQLGQTAETAKYFYYRFAFRAEAGYPAETHALARLVDATGTVIELNLLGSAGNVLECNSQVGGFTAIGEPSPEIEAGKYYVVEIAILVPASGNGVVKWRVSQEALEDFHPLQENASCPVRNTGITNYRVGKILSRNGTFYFDDLAVNSADGAEVDGEWCGLGHVVHLWPVGDKALGTGWQNPDNSTTKLYEDVDNVPPLGVASPGEGKSQIKNASPEAGELAYDAEVQSYNEAGIPEGAKIVSFLRGIYRIAGSSTTGTNNAKAKIVSNPNELATTTFTGGFDTQAEAEPAKWRTWSTAAVQNLASIERNVRPVLRIIKNAATERVHMVDQMSIQVEYVEAEELPTADGEATITATSAVSGAGNVVHSGEATVSASAALSAAANVVLSGQATIAATASVSATGSIVLNGEGTIAASATVAAEAGVVQAGSATISATATLTAAGAARANGEATIAGSALVSATGGTVANGAATIAGQASIGAEGSAISNGEATIVSTSTISGVGEVPGEVAATISAVSTITAEGTVVANGEATIVSQATITAEGEVGQAEVLHIQTRATVIPVGAK